METTTESGLTEDEQKVMISLIEAWNNFTKLTNYHHDDLHSFRHGINQCQQILAMRSMHRIYPEYWK